MQKNWLISRGIDLGLLLLPVWIVWALILCLPAATLEMDVPLWMWVVLVLGIDVSHVWSTIFRTYADKEEFGNHKLFLTLLPLLVFVTAFTTIWFSEVWFWRLMAYVAVFHFIKQQYGFTALYRVKEKKRKQFLGDKFVIYLAALYPVLYWHLNPEASFHWFIDGDFLPIASWVSSASSWLSPTLFALHFVYWGLILAWLIQEISAYKKDADNVSIGKVFWVLTTALNWFGGIVAFNSDIVFTVSNVVAHGIPYVTLIWYYKAQKTKMEEHVVTPFVKRLRWVVILLFSILLLAFVEEYFWDMLIWRDRAAFFSTVVPYGVEQMVSPLGYAFALALLALPQLTHYFIDGVIWKVNAKNPYLRKIFFPQR